jgi:hypothetical protein
MKSKRISWGKNKMVAIELENAVVVFGNEHSSP